VCFVVCDPALTHFELSHNFFQALVGTIRRSSNSPPQYVRTIEDVYIHEQVPSKFSTIIVQLLLNSSYLAPALGVIKYTIAGGV